MASLRLVYFSWVRETVGTDTEVRDIPDCVVDIGDCIGWLTREGEHYRTAFANPAKLRFALDQHMATSVSPLAGARELAIFPPVTGG